ncbi:MAG: DUF1571 domain-containing protein [Planctomycetaceae bacterium]|nr:DUF1571 domain-containing protein [Planctomycetaceae bacterium]
MTSNRSCVLRRLFATATLVAFCVPIGAADDPVQRPLQRSTPGGGRPAATQSPAAGAAATPAQEQPAVDEHPLIPAIRLAEHSLESLATVKDYQALIARRELVNGELVVESMQLKFREEPFSVYLLFGGANAGREVLYVDGRNDNKLMAHEGSGLASFIGTISLAPDNPQVTKQSRHKITEIGLRNMLGALVARWEEESKYGEIDVKYYHNARISERPCLAIECSHPRPRKQFKFHITRLYIDKESDIAVRLENWGFPTQQNGNPVLIEEYTYSNVKTNVGFTDADFDRSNPAYRF